MSIRTETPSIRVLSDDVANKIAAGEVVERPASVVKELIENSLDAGATRIVVRAVAAGRRLIEVIDNGHGMSEQNAVLAIERHATSKIRTVKDLEAIRTLGFRGEALASMAAVSRFELTTRRAKDEAATRVRVDGGILRDVSQAGAPVGTRITVNRLYFNTPVRAKFLKGVTTELGHCIDIVQRHALAHLGVGFQFFHNDKSLLDIPEHAALKERVALIWGLTFARDMMEIEGEQAGFRLRGVIGLPGLTRAQRSHQFFFMNERPVINRSLQYGFEDGYRGLVTIGRHPVGVILMDTHPRFVDVNIHPTKREIRFRDERAARDAVRDIVRHSLSRIPRESVAVPPSSVRLEGPTREGEPHREGERTREPVESFPRPQSSPAGRGGKVLESAGIVRADTEVWSKTPPAPARRLPDISLEGVHTPEAEDPIVAPPEDEPPIEAITVSYEQAASFFPEGLPGVAPPSQGHLPGMSAPGPGVAPKAVYEPIAGINDAPMQIFDTYLLVPDRDRLLIIDQHALHERLNFDSLLAELEDQTYESQQLAVPMVIEVAPSQVRLVESNLKLFSRIGIEVEPFGGNTFQITAVCHLYDDSKVRDLVYRVLDELAQGDLFDRENVLADVLRLATRACKASVRAGDRLTPAERRGLLDGFRRLTPPYTCPHGRPILTELTLHQMEKSFRRIQ
ncbi:MAG: DNA mismatch repair endonuclease MutL [Candidatus Hydrogenedentes bacterium]|nr:DNA mismatch repair endonuclease MutL [Candidatus Hydrogenedentota bacterium]